MNRRKFITALGGITMGSGLILSSGAFTSVEADRSVTIETTADSQAFLRMQPDSSNFRAAVGEDVVEFHIPGLQDSAKGEGIGVDSVYRFSELLDIYNQGTQPVQIRSRYNGDAFTEIALISNGERVNENPPVIDEGGDPVKVGLLIDSTGSEVGEFSETLTIIAEPSDE